MGQNADRRFSDTENSKKQGNKQIKSCHIQEYWNLLFGLQQWTGWEKTQGSLLLSDQIIKYSEFQAKYLTHLRGNAKSLKVFKQQNNTIKFIL